MVSEEQEKVCPNCGTREEEWELDKFGRPTAVPYEPVLHQCPGCFEIAQFSKENKQREGTTIRLQRVTEKNDPDI